jgi:hypothetical protein
MGKKKPKVCCACNISSYWHWFPLYYLPSPHTFACSSPLSPHTHNSHFHDLTTFIVVEFFFYGLLALKTLCNLTSSCCYKVHPPSHTHEKQKHKKKQIKKTQETTHKQTQK